MLMFPMLKLSYCSPMWSIMILTLTFIGCQPKGDVSSPDTDLDSIWTNTTDPCAPNPNLATLTIGKGEFEYNPIDKDGQTIELIHGPQGGYHIVMALEATFVDAETQGVASMSGTINGKQYAFSMPYIDLRCNYEVGALQSWGHLLIYDADYEWLHQKETSIQVELTDASNNIISNKTTVTIIDPYLE